MKEVEIIVIDDQVKFMLDGKEVFLNEDGEEALATIIIYREFKELFKNPNFKDCPDKILDGYIEVKKDYEKLMKRIN